MKYRTLDELSLDGKYVGNVVYPLQQTAIAVPNPTIFWVLSPDFHKRISHLEKTGLIVQFEQRLNENPKFLEIYRKQHEWYRDHRRAMLSPEHQEYVISRGWRDKLDSGIGGIRDWTKIKCLHLHFAHYCFNGDNIIGSWVNDLLKGGGPRVPPFPPSVFKMGQLNVP